MPWREILLLYMYLVHGHVASPPSYNVRACGEDGELTFSAGLQLCYTKSSHWNVLDKGSAKTFCQLRGGKLATNNTIESIQPRLPSQFSGDVRLWSDIDDCSYWEILLRAKPVRKPTSCESRFPVMCKWAPGTTPGKCRGPYRRGGFKCYRVFGDFLDSVDYPISKEDARQRAEQRCREDGATLANLTTEMQHSLFASMIQGYSSVSVIVKGKSNNIFIILGDGEVRPGRFVNYNRDFTHVGFICEKGMTKTKESRDSSLLPRDTQVYMCGEDFKTFDEKHDLCFKLLNENDKKNWAEANKLCEENGASLASIHSNYDNAIVHLVRLQLKDDMWIGLKGDSWSDGTQVVFSKQPRGSRSGDCGVMADDGRWKSVSCTVNKQIACFKRKRNAELLPKQCDAGAGVQFDGTCHSKTKCNITLEWRTPSPKSKRQVAFLLNWALGLRNEEKCLKINTSDVNFNYFLPRGFTSNPKYVDYLGRRVSGDGCTGKPAIICEEVKQPSQTTQKSIPSPSPKETDNSILIIALLSGLLGATIIIFAVGVTVYCVVFRPRTAVPLALEANAKPKPQPKPHPATIGNRPQPPLQVPSLPPLPGMQMEDDEGMMEEIYEEMDAM